MDQPIHVLRCLAHLQHVDHFFDRWVEQFLWDFFLVKDFFDLDKLVLGNGDQNVQVLDEGVEEGFFDDSRELHQENEHQERRDLANYRPYRSLQTTKRADDIENCEEPKGELPLSKVKFQVDTDFVVSVVALAKWDSTCCVCLLAFAPNDLKLQKNS